MPRNTDPELHMFLIEERPDAVRVGDNAFRAQCAVVQWIPRSLIGYSRKTKPDPDHPDRLPEYVFTLPDWKIEQADLWDFVP
jgi:hypothetical protein